HGLLSTTTPEGNPEYPFDLAELAAAAGANYVARWTVRHVHELVKAFEKAMQKEGFSFVEAVSGCPTGFGRRNRMGDPVQLMEWLKSISVKREKLKTYELDHMDVNTKGLITVGEFVDRNRMSLLQILNAYREKKAQEEPAIG
ncbi:MAG: thiamine pyrophosphate-dependent enzyme, partial [Thermoplasmata archaeon]|nr:thiamine pyrophosphate-dependent enzyme [Thermoplasmata archaeon]